MIPVEAVDNQKKTKGLHSYGLTVHIVKVSGMFSESGSETAAVKVRADARLVKHVIL